MGKINLTISNYNKDNDLIILFKNIIKLDLQRAQFQHMLFVKSINQKSQRVPGGSVVKNLPASADVGSVLGLGR